MCLVVFALGVHPEAPLVVLANRDEAYARPSDPAHVWTAPPGLVGGRDREKGGTWLGIAPGGRFAAVTNVRSPGARRDGRSRGHLVRDALSWPGTTEAFLRGVERETFPSFNLLVGEPRALFSLGDDAPAAPVPPGVHGLSNARLDVPWPKVVRATRDLATLLGEGGDGPDVDAAFEILADRTPAGDEALPSTGVPLDLERALSPIFLALPSYGTRASTVVIARRDGSMLLEERTFGPEGAPIGRAHHALPPAAG